MYQFNQVPSEAKIQKYLRRIIFGKNIYCPGCKGNRVYVAQGRYRCRKCRQRFSLLSHTWLANKKLTLQQLWLILWCWTTQIPIRQTISLTHLSEVTIRHWFSVFRQHLPEEETILDHLVQLDEVYFGGRNKPTTLFMAKQVSSLGERKLAYQLIKGEYPVIENMLGGLCKLTLNLKPLCLLTEFLSTRKLISGGPFITPRIFTRNGSLNRRQRLKGCLGSCVPLSEGCIIMSLFTMDKLPSIVGEFCYRFSHPEMFENPRYFLQISLRLVPTR